MKKLILILLVIVVAFFTSKFHYAEDSTFVHIPKHINEFNDNLSKFMSDGDISVIEKYIKPSSELIKGKTSYKCFTDSEKEIFQKEFTEGVNVEGVSYKAWSSDGKYYYIILTSSPNKESASYNSIFIEVTNDKNIIIKVWHKS